QIHAIDPQYPDPKNVAMIAKKELVAAKPLEEAAAVVEAPAEVVRPTARAVDWRIVTYVAIGFAVGGAAVGLLWEPIYELFQTPVIYSILTDLIWGGVGGTSVWLALRGRARTRLLPLVGAIGFAWGGLPQSLLVFPYSGSGILIYSLQGLGVGVAFGVAMRDKKKAAILALAGAVGFAIGYPIGYAIGGSGILIYSLQGLCVGVAFGVAMRDNRKAAILALAGAVGFAIGYAIARAIGISGFVWGAISGVIGGAALGLGLGFVEKTAD
ncbi:MAG: hypothetical protein ACE5NP_02090, partial [Anaerolineae bacterium]